MDSRYDRRLPHNQIQEPLLTLQCLRAVPALLTATCVAACTMATTATSVPGQGAPAGRSEKELRTAAQQKIDSQLLYEIYRKRGQAEEKNVPPDATRVRLDKNDRALVDIRAVVTPALLAKVKKSGATIVSSSTPVPLNHCPRAAPPARAARG